MNESWFDSIRFSLSAILAACLFAAAALSPLAVRNENFKQFCYEKQLELIDLEADINRRKLFLQRIENSPELIDQISRQPDSSAVIEPTEQSFDLPESLTIHPDQMLIASEQIEANNTEKQQRSSTQLSRLTEKIAGSTELQNRLLLSSLLVLLLGIIPTSWFHWRFFTGKLETITTAIFSRYRFHYAHKNNPPPHWENSEPTESQPEKQQRPRKVLPKTR